jgi:hypothetical protein
MTTIHRYWAQKSTIRTIAEFIIAGGGFVRSQHWNRRTNALARKIVRLLNQIFSVHTVMREPKTDFPAT